MLGRGRTYKKDSKSIFELDYGLLYPPTSFSAGNRWAHASRNCLSRIPDVFWVVCSWMRRGGGGNIKKHVFFLLTSPRSVNALCVSIMAYKLLTLLLIMNNRLTHTGLYLITVNHFDLSPLPFAVIRTGLFSVISHFFILAPPSVRRFFWTSHPIIGNTWHVPSR